MMVDVVVDKRGNEKVAMIVTCMLTVRQRLPGVAARFDECRRLQLLIEKRIGQALIDQNTR